MCWNSWLELFEDARSCDVVFVFDGGERVQTHKTLLPACSDMFDTMLHGSLKEMGEIRIEDVSAAAFKTFLKYFHFGGTNLNGSNVAELLYLGEKYIVEQCVNDCVEFLLSVLDVENVLVQLHLAIIHGQQSIKSRCDQLIYTHIETILSSDAFQESSNSTSQA